MTAWLALGAGVISGLLAIGILLVGSVWLVLQLFLGRKSP